MLTIGCKLESVTDAVRWFRLTADQGDAESQVGLGMMYIEGHFSLEHQRFPYLSELGAAPGWNTARTE